MKKPLIFGRKHFRNSQIDSYNGGDFIVGQEYGDVSKMKYGLCRMSFNGCECIAVFNALLYLGIKTRLWQVVRRLERHRMLFGIFGCNPRKIGKALCFFGAGYEFCTDAEKDGGYIFSYWTGRRFFSSLHTVFAVKKDNELTVYNKYGNSRLIYHYKSLADMLDGKKLIKAYHLKK